MFTSKKKRLWRARVTITAAIAATPNQQQPQRLHQRLHHLPQSNCYQTQQSQQRNGNCSTVSCYCDHQNMTIDNRNYHHNHNYQNLSNYYGTESENRKLMKMDTSSSPPHPIIEDYRGMNITNGCYCFESCGENSNDCNEDDCDQTMSSTSTTASNSALISERQQQPQQQQPQHQQHYHQQQQQKQQQTPPPNTTTTTTTTTTALPLPTPITSMASTMATTAANVFRNCCGVGCLSTDSMSSNTNYNYNTNYNNNNNNNAKKNCFEKLYNTRNSTATPEIPNGKEQKKMFDALIRNLTEMQLTTLVHAVEKRSTGVNVGHQPDCVLVSRALKMEEEPNLIACRLWLWPDLKSSMELKRIPSCPNEKDRVYVCCNPTHWSRICLSDTPPPPYQPLAMERLNYEDRAPSESLKDGGGYTNTSTSSCTGYHRSQFQGSLTTDGEDSKLPSLTWCQLAYWELSQRIGGRFPVENSSVNVFSDEPHGGGMCLKTLADQRRTATPDSVIRARQKIGLGITLSQESDGVWLYNRSSVPVFVHSPTLNDVEFNWFLVSKVPPGYCILAFDSHRARTQRCPSQVVGYQTGPIDTNSMRISFAKGWGRNYTRQEVTACPCWLEVLFSRR